MNWLTLVVPGLVWPAQQTPRPAGDVPHAALGRLLGRGRLRTEAAVSPECLLARLLDAELPDKALPLAALRQLGEEGGRDADRAESGAHWLCADPVNLSFMGGHLLPDAFHEEEIDMGEAVALIASLNADFAGLGHFSAATPTRWYLRMESPAKADFSPLDDAVCRPMQDFLPTGSDGREVRRWQHAMNEIQVVLHNHPVNEARKAAGRRLINGLWFWGGGSPVSRPPRIPRFAVQAETPLPCGLARFAGFEPNALSPDSALQADTLVVLDTLASPARHLDLDVWQEGLAALEEGWFKPVAHALSRGNLRRLTLWVPSERGCFSFTLGRGASWCFWRKPLSLNDFHARIVTPRLSAPT